MIKITPTSRYSTAEFVERHVLPVVAAFALGMVLAQLTFENRLSAAQEALAVSIKQTDRALVLIAQQNEVCAPLMSWPLESAPELLTASAGVTGAMGATTGASQ